MNGDAITRIKLDTDPPTVGATNWDKLKALSEADIALAAATDPDSPLTPLRMQPLVRPFAYILVLTQFRNVSNKN